MFVEVKWGVKARDLPVSPPLGAGQELTEREAASLTLSR